MRHKAPRNASSINLNAQSNYLAQEARHEIRQTIRFHVGRTACCDRHHRSTPGALLPAVQAAREAARRMSCINNLTQLALAVQNYDATYRVYPAGTLNPTGPIADVAQGQHHNWLIQLLPYFEEQNTYNHVDFNASVYDEKNAPVRKVQIRVLVCPSSPVDTKDVSHTSYAGLHYDVDAPIDANNNGIFFLNSAVRYEDIRDGATHTIFIGEKLPDGQFDLGWMSGTHSTLRNTGIAINAGRPRYATNVPATPPTSIATGYSSFHPGGANFAFGDGHVGFLSETTALDVYQQLGHRADGKLLTHRDH